MTTIKFSEHKEAILKALNEKVGSHGIQEPTSLVTGFFNQPVYGVVSESVIIGGPTIPMGAVVGNNSGRVYFFALTALLPNLEM